MVSWAIAKRTFDVVASIIVLVIVSPLLILACVLIFVEDRNNVFFLQDRVGMNGRQFKVIKLRTMRVNHLSPHQLGQVSNNHVLVTRVGRLLRRFKVDELPQLINVVANQMSLVGPRPTILEQVTQYSDFQARRMLVRPGMTGWAQINGNVELDWEDRIRLDVWYVDHWTFLLDIRILFQTCFVVLGGEHTNSQNVSIARSYAYSINRNG